jgi:hypothetical protein
LHLMDSASISTSPFKGYSGTGHRPSAASHCLTW